MFFLMFWLWRYAAFILWSGLCRVYRQHWGSAYLVLQHRGWRVRVEEEEQRPAAFPVALAARRAADWQTVDALLQSLRDPSAGAEDQAA